MLTENCVSVSERKNVDAAVVVVFCAEMSAGKTINKCEKDTFSYVKTAAIVSTYK